MREYTEFAEISVREFRGSGLDSYWLCGACYRQIKGFIWGGEMRERMDEPQEQEQEDRKAQDERGETVSARGGEEKEGLEEIWDEIRFR